MSEKINGKQFQSAMIRAAENLIEQKEMLNQLNLFPVADQDTGTNMALTLQQTAAHLPAAETPAHMMEQAGFALLEYSHGNSGTILALFFDGFAEALPESATITGKELAAAFRKGADAAWRSVEDPVTGTILSVASQSADAGISLSELLDDAGQVMKRICDEAHASLLLTPIQNPVLRESGTVDAGALGFCLLLDGFLEAFAPEYRPLSYPALQVPAEAMLQNPRTPLMQRYCIELVLQLSDDSDPALLRQTVQPLGEYFLLVQHGSLCKIHIHTNVPSEVLSASAQFGILQSQKIDDMTGTES